VLVSITASREKDEIVYRVDCAKGLTDEEFEYYLSEIISGICLWKKGICEEGLRSFKGAVKKGRPEFPAILPKEKHRHLTSNWLYIVLSEISSQGITDVNELFFSTFEA